MEDEKIFDLSPKVGKKRIPKGFMTFTLGTKLSQGDRIFADLGGIEYASGYIENPEEKNVFGEVGVSFWSFSGWKHLEFAKYKEILAYKRRNLK